MFNLKKISKKEPISTELFQRYLDEKTIKKWFDPTKKWPNQERLPTQEQMADVFMKAAKDFKTGKLNIEEFTIICGNLYFGAYVQLDFYEKDRIDLRIIDAMREFADPDGETQDQEAAKKGVYHVNEEWQKKLLGFVE